MKKPINTSKIEGLAESAPELTELIHKSAKQSRKRLRKIAKRNDRNIRLLVRIEKAISDLKTVIQSKETEIKELNDYRPVDRYSEEHRINSWITKVAAGAIVSCASIGTAYALSFKITKTLGEDGFLTGLAIVIPFTFAGIIIKQIVNHGGLAEWKVGVERLMIALFVIALILTFQEVNVHFLQIVPEVAPDYDMSSDSTAPIVEPLPQLRQSYGGLYGGLLYIEYAISYFGSALWQRSTDRRRNRKDTAIDTEIAPLKAKVIRCQKKLGKLEAKKAVISNRLERDRATAEVIQSILSKSKS